jgi:hypothetical protein
MGNSSNDDQSESSAVSGWAGLGELFLQSTVIAYWFKVVLAMMWKPVTTSGSMATTVSA